MNKPNIAALFNIPKADDKNAGPRLKEILTQHLYSDPDTDRDITALLNEKVTSLASPNEGIVACFGFFVRSIGSAFPECRTSFEFLNNDTCVVSCHDGQPTVYDSWLKGYVRLVHDIREYWKQRMVDAQVVSQEYELLWDRLPNK